MKELIIHADVIFCLAAMVFAVNFTTQFLKPLTYKYIPTQFLCLVISMAVTICSVIAYCQIVGITILWYIIAAAILLAVGIAYIAMFGFNTFKEAMADPKLLYKFLKTLFGKTSVK